jgi:hypothetical protein
MLTPCLRLPLLQLYVIPAPTSGEEALPPLAAPVQGLHLSDEGRPLWAVPGAEPGPDGGLDLGPAQVGLGVCGAGPRPPPPPPRRAPPPPPPARSPLLSRGLTVSCVGEGSACSPC